MDQDKVVFLVDVDNTLLDNDRIISDLVGYLEREVGHDCKQRYWTIFEEMRNELGYADYLGALQCYRVENPRDHRSRCRLILPSIRSRTVFFQAP